MMLFVSRVWLLASLFVATATATATATTDAADSIEVRPVVYMDEYLL
jgi:hypothetical protein